MAKRVLILGNSGLVVFGMRGELIQRLIKDGFEVVTSFPTGILGEGEELSGKYGCIYVDIPIDRRGTNVIRDTELLWNYVKLINEIKPDVVLLYTVKCCVYGGIACRLLKVPYIMNITGLGKGLAEGGIKQKILVMLYKMAAKSALVFFQNKQDQKFFEEHKIPYKKSGLLPGSGVNLDKFSPLPYPEDEKIIFTYIARIMKTKGIDEFLEVARAIKAEYSNVEFHVCGYYEDDYKEVIESAQEQGTIVYHGLVKDVRPYEEASHCIVLPTYHPEGISNVLLEAAACARPIITTNRPGCREVVDDGITGFLMKEKDSQDLLGKMRKFLSMENSEREAMGTKARKKVEDEFDRKIVVEAYMTEIRRIQGALTA